MRPGTTDPAGVVESLDAAALRDVAADRIVAAWSATVETFRDPESAQRRELDPRLAGACGLSAAGVTAGLEAVLGGVARTHAERLVERAASPGGDGLVLAVLASNIPGLAVQPLLPALALRRPIVLKSSTEEPHFAPAFVEELAARLPPIASAVAVLSWPGGDAEFERPLLDAARDVVAYGGAAAISDLERRASGRVLDYGPKLSVAIVSEQALCDRVESVATGLARDVALFDQRGCLSVQAVLCQGDGVGLAAALTHALDRLADELPAGPIEPAVASRVHQMRAEAAMRGLWVSDLSPTRGTVVVESDRAPLRPSPGMRTVRIHPVDEASDAVDRLADWSGSLQGVAVAGETARQLAPRLEALGVTRLAAPGELQHPDVSWQNGGRDLIDVLAWCE